MSFDEVHWRTERRRDVPRDNDWLTPRESEVLSGLKVVKRRADWRLGRWTAKNLAREQLAAPGEPPAYRDIEILAANNGSPHVLLRGRPAGIGISISHSNGIGFCALIARPTEVGCDTELIERRSASFVLDYFSREERTQVEQVAVSDRARVATLIWSAKESVLKVMQEGLRRDTRDVIIDIGDTTCEVGRWRRFTGRLADGSDSFKGLWRATNAHVQTLAIREAPSCNTAT